MESSVTASQRELRKALRLRYFSAEADGAVFEANSSRQSTVADVAWDTPQWTPRQGSRLSSSTRSSCSFPTHSPRKRTSIESLQTPRIPEEEPHEVHAAQCP